METLLITTGAGASHDVADSCEINLNSEYKPVLTRFLFIGLFNFLFFTFFSGIGFAETSGIKISEPLSGSKINPGQQLTVKVNSVNGFIPIQVLIVTPFSVDTLKSTPFTVNLVVPNEAAGTIYISATGKNALGKFASDEVTVNVEQTAILESLEINQDEIFVDLDWDGNIKGKTSDNFVTIYGIYSDGVKRILDDDPRTTYLSSNTSVISVDDNGNYQVHTVGKAKITISNSGKSKDIPVVFLKQRGIKPAETTAPVTQVHIEPPPNNAGWHNKDITITLTANDNEGGSGIKEIQYALIGTRLIKTKEQTVESNEAKLFISQEGMARFMYNARDNQRNVEEPHFVDINLDKTPPDITVTATPNTIWPPNNTMVDVTVKGEATDKLSGIESISFKVGDEYGKIQPLVSAFGSTIKLEASRKGDDQDGRIYTITATAKDKAGNESSSSAKVTVPHDMGKEPQ